jgi:hypothetical protein
MTLFLWARPTCFIFPPSHCNWAPLASQTAPSLLPCLCTTPTPPTRFRCSRAATGRAPPPCCHASPPAPPPPDTPLPHTGPSNHRRRLSPVFPLHTPLTLTHVTALSPSSPHPLLHGSAGTLAAATTIEHGAGAGVPSSLRRRVASSSMCLVSESHNPLPYLVQPPPLPRGFTVGHAAPRLLCPRWAPHQRRCTMRGYRAGRSRARTTCGRARAAGPSQ